MRVLVTRPLDDGRETAALLEARGHTAIVAPLLSVRFHDGPPLDLDSVQALLVTSANGARALARRTARRDLPVFAVGPQTAAEAHACGFAHVHSGAGDASALADAVRAKLSPADGIIVHAAGAEAEGKLAAALTTAGFAVRTAVLYDVPAAAKLPENARTALAEARVDAVLLYSARSAEALATSIANAGLTAALERVTACCISANAAQPLAALPLRVRIAPAPNQDALLSLLDASEGP